MTLVLRGLWLQQMLLSRTRKTSSRISLLHLANFEAPNLMFSESGRVSIPLPLQLALLHLFWHCESFQLLNWSQMTNA